MKYNMNGTLKYYAKKKQARHKMIHGEWFNLHKILAAGKSTE